MIFPHAIYHSLQSFICIIDESSHNFSSQFHIFFCTPQTLSEELSSPLLRSASSSIPKPASSPTNQSPFDVELISPHSLQS